MKASNILISWQLIYCLRCWVAGPAYWQKRLIDHHICGIGCKPLLPSNCISNFSIFSTAPAVRSPLKQEVFFIKRDFIAKKGYWKGTNARLLQVTCLKFPRNIWTLFSGAHRQQLSCSHTKENLSCQKRLCTMSRCSRPLPKTPSTTAPRLIT